MSELVVSTVAVWLVDVVMKLMAAMKTAKMKVGSNEAQQIIRRSNHKTFGTVRSLEIRRSEVMF